MLLLNPLQWVMGDSMWQSWCPLTKVPLNSHSWLPALFLGNLFSRDYLQVGSEEKRENTRITSSPLAQGNVV